jgi:predicted nucleic acid-binding protein
VIVVDSNVLAAKCLTSARTDTAEQVEQIDPVWIVPPLWRYEFQNFLAKAIWARQIMPGDAVGIWREVLARMSDNEHEPSGGKVLELAARHRITGYDANFIALAMEMGVVCVTEDTELHDKFPGEALCMDSFITMNPDVGQVHEARAEYHVRKRKKRRGN